MFYNFALSHYIKHCHRQKQSCTFYYFYVSYHSKIPFHRKHPFVHPSKCCSVVSHKNMFSHYMQTIYFHISRFGLYWLWRTLHIWLKNFKICKTKHQNERNILFTQPIHDGISGHRIWSIFNFSWNNFEILMLHVLFLIIISVLCAC